MSVGTVPQNGNGTGTAVSRQQPQRLIVQDTGVDADLMDTARFEHLYRVAKMMSLTSLCPKHLQGKTAEEGAANCFLVVQQARRWGFDPFAIMGETYVVGGKLAYQGKLVAAVVNARAGLREGRLSFSFTGAGENRTIKIWGTLPGEDSPRDIEVILRNVKTANDMWTKDPDQKLVYTGAIKWARRHCPEIILGVVTDDDLEIMRLEAEARTLPPTGGTKTDRIASRLPPEPESEQQPTNEAPVVTKPEEKPEAKAETREPGDEDGGEIDDFQARVVSDFGACETADQCRSQQQQFFDANPTEAQKRFVKSACGARIKELEAK